MVTSPPNLLTQPQRLFDRKEIVGIDDRRNALAHDRVGHRVNTDLRRIGHLLHADDDMHWSCSLMFAKRSLQNVELHQ